MSEDMPGAVAIWHDIAPEGLDEFYAWHGEEHMPERVGIPGFVRGRRFIALDANLGFFNLYETSAFSAVAGPGYRARLDSPTPRTLETVRHFRNVARSLCRVSAAQGTAQGGIVATLRYGVEEGRVAGHAETMARDWVPALAAEPGIASVRLLVADAAASGYVNAEQRARGAANLVPSHVLIAEGWGGEAPFMVLIRARLAPEALAGLGIAADASLGFYRHQMTVERPPG